MRFRLFAIFCFLFTLQSTAQVNYVLNPSFEEHTGCPHANDQIRLATYWNEIDTIVTNPLCSPEYCNACSGIHSPWGVPGDAVYYQYPRTGGGMVQALMFSDESCPNVYIYYKRDYIQGHLSQPLLAGHSYCVTFYVVLANQSPYANDQIGAYLDDGTIDTASSDSFECASPQTQYIPQVISNTIITDTQNWVKIEGSFIANGTERFITIGNFSDKANTHVLAVADTVGITASGGWSWYLVDDVSVVESDLPAYAGNDTTINQGDSAFIGRNDLLPGIKWRIDTTVIDSLNAGIWVHPNQTTTYTVEQTLCGVVKYDTVTITVIPQDTTIDTTEAVPYLKYKTGFTLYPNPSSGNITIYSSTLADQHVEMDVLDVSGRVTEKKKIKFDGYFSNAQIDLMPGIYLIELRNIVGGKFLQRLTIK